MANQAPHLTCGMRAVAYSLGRIAEGPLAGTSDPENENIIN